MREKPKTRRLPLFTRGQFKELDILKIQWDLMAELPYRMRYANLAFIADKLGCELIAKRS